jgi:hypothetical protein
MVVKNTSRRANRRKTKHPMEPVRCREVVGGNLEGKEMEATPKFGHHWHWPFGYWRGVKVSTWRELLARVPVPRGGFQAQGLVVQMFGSGRGSVGSIGGTKKAKDLREVEDSGGQWQVNLCQDKSRGVAVVSLPHRAGRRKPRLQLPYPDEYDLPL